MYGAPTPARWSTTGWMNIAVSSSGSYGMGAGAYAPMPPVLGPVSPSPMRLWSCATGSGRATVPSHTAIRLHSGPDSRSSSTMGPSSESSRMAASVAASPSGTMTPLPAARPSSFTTTGRANVRHHARASSADDDRWNAGEGMPRRSASVRVNPFDPSSFASAALGPKHGTPASMQRSATPATSAASGPTMTRSASTGEGRSAATRTSCPCRRQAQAMAASRPPLPMTSTLIAPTHPSLALARASGPAQRQS